MQVFLSVEAFVPELRGLNRQEAFFFFSFLTPLRFGLLFVPALTHPNLPLYPTGKKRILLFYASPQLAHTLISDIFISLKGPRECPELSIKNKSLLFVTMGCYGRRAGRGEKSPE